MPVQSTVTVRTLLLSVLQAAAGQPVSVRTLLRVATLLGVTSNATRVALTRLVQEGSVESDERGQYQQATRTQQYSQNFQDWNLTERKVRAWKGGWIACMLERSARKSPIKGRSMRALHLFGFREAMTDLWVRPDNLIATLDLTRERLVTSGLEASSELFQLAGASAPFDAKMRALWPRDALIASYDRMDVALKKSHARLRSLKLETALVETFDLGRAAMALLGRDPLLPGELVPEEGRKLLAMTLRAYELHVRQLWSTVVPDFPGISMSFHASASAGASQQ